MAEQRIVRLDRNGPGGKGLEHWGAFAPDMVMSGAPVESGYNFYTDQSGQYTAGVWECTAGKTRIESFPVDEYCIILAGRVVITDAQGKGEEFKTGEAFVIPRGFNGTWDMPETVRKFYVIFERKAEAQRQAAE